MIAWYLDEFGILRVVRFRVWSGVREVRCRVRWWCLVGFRKWTAKFYDVVHEGWISLSSSMFFVWILLGLRYDQRIIIKLFTMAHYSIVIGLNSYVAVSWYPNFPWSSKNWNNCSTKFSRPHFSHSHLLTPSNSSCPNFSITDPSISQSPHSDV